MAKGSSVKKSAQRRICLISPSHPCSNPRLVKEADALVEAGYVVDVVCSRYMPELDGFDRVVLASPGWNVMVVDHTPPERRLRYALERRLARLSPWIAQKFPLSAHLPPARDLLPAARGVDADLYIAHVLGALPIAVSAARARGRLAGFDAEDFHSGEIASGPAGDLAARRCLEKLARHCVHRTASSPGIARRYAELTGQPFQTVLNVFPLTMAPKLPRPVPKVFTEEDPASFYWFSQTVGPGRGLEEFLVILNHLKTPWRLALRGWCANSYAETLQRISRRPLEFLPPAPPQEMAALATAHDFGLSAELCAPENRDLCLTNKIFTCLLAGLPVVMSRTSAQTELATELGEAALLLDLRKAEVSAQILEALLTSLERRHSAAAAAFQIARNRFNWDIEKHIFLRSVESVLTSIAGK